MAHPLPADVGPSLPLRPLSAVAWGLVVVILDFRYNGVDLVPDPVGWMFVAVALTSLQGVHRAFGTAGLLAWVGLLLSIPEWFRAGPELLGLALVVVAVVLQVVVCTAVMAVSPLRRSAAETIRWLSPSLAVGLVLAIFATRDDAGSPALVLALGVAGLIVILWFLVLLLQVAREPGPVAGGDPGQPDDASVDQAADPPA